MNSEEAAKFIEKCVKNKSTDQEVLQRCADLIPLCPSISKKCIRYVYTNLGNPQPSALLEGLRFNTYKDWKDYIKSNLLHVNALCDGSPWWDHVDLKKHKKEVINVLAGHRFNPNPFPEDVITDLHLSQYDCDELIMCLITYGLKIQLDTFSKLSYNNIKRVVTEYDYTMTTERAIEVFDEHTLLSLHFLDSTHIEELGYERIFNILDKELDPNNTKNDYLLIIDLLDYITSVISDDLEIQKSCIEYILVNNVFLSTDDMCRWFEVMSVEEISFCIGNNERFTVLGVSENVSPATFAKTLMGFSIPAIENVLKRLPDEYRVIAETYIHGVGEVQRSLVTKRCKQAE